MTTLKLKRYAHPFNIRQIKRFTGISKNEVRGSLMSIYSFILKLQKETDSSIIKSNFETLSSDYNRFASHRKIGKTTFRKRLLILCELGLITVKSENKKTIIATTSLPPIQNVVDDASEVMYKLRTMSEQELTFLNQIENEKIRKSAMSVYSYLIKLFVEKKSSATIEFGLRKFLKRYNYYRVKKGMSMSAPTLKSRLELLEKIGLITLVKNPSVLPRIRKTKVVLNLDIYKKIYTSANDNEDLEKTESLDITEFEENLIENEPIKALELQMSKKAIYTSSCISNKDYAIKLCKDVCKSLGIKTKLVKNAVIIKILENNRYKTIQIQGAVSYIAAIAQEKYAIYKAQALETKKFFMNKHYVERKKAEKVLNFCNYEQRNYDYAAHEEDLMGWF